MNNTIVVRVADFLKNYLPFSLLTEEELLKIAKSAAVVYREADDIIFSPGDPSLPEFFVLREGLVHLRRRRDGGHQLLDTCDEGDLFGIYALLGGDAYTQEAVCAEASLLYAIPIAAFSPVLEQYPAVKYFLSRFAVLDQSVDFQPGSHLDLLAGDSPLRAWPEDLSETHPLQQQRPLVSCLPDRSIREVARQMRRAGVGSMVVCDPQGHPLGILTDKDLRNRVVTGEVNPDEKIGKVMSSPVLTIPAGLSVAEVQIRMIKSGVHHLVVTETGQADSPATGVISEHDLLIAQANNPAVFVRRIRKCRTREELVEVRALAQGLLPRYLGQQVQIRFVAEMMSSINDALIQQAIELAREALQERGIHPPNARFCWLGLGSEGRQEQLLRTDQDSALIFLPGDGASLDSCRTYFLQLAGLVTDTLAAAGFMPCPADMMASNPQWCLSLEEWQAQFHRWIQTPTQEALLMSTIFFDFRPVFGATELAERLEAFVFDHIDRQTPFLPFLARNALKSPPPLSFFRNFVVERSGEHSAEFDLKARAMMPLTDAARLLILAAKEGGITNTLDRFGRLAQLEPKQADLYHQAADAYAILMRLRARYGLQNKDSGRYIDPKDLSKMEKLSLRNAFRPISELQTVISTRFNLALLM